MMDRINEVIDLGMMSKQEAYDWLGDLNSLIDGQLDALDSELEEEGEDGEGEE